MVCAVVSVPFIRSNRTHSGGATVVLRRPHHTQTIRGDGNCLFRGWVRYSPSAMQSGMHDDVTTKSMFLRNYDELF